MTGPVRRFGILGNTSAETIQPVSPRSESCGLIGVASGSRRRENLAAHAPRSSERFGECLARNKETDESDGYPQNDLNAQIAHSTWPWSLGRLTAETKGGAPWALPPDLQVKA
jgi:hypothetical protein